MTASLGTSLVELFHLWKAVNSDITLFCLGTDRSDNSAKLLSRLKFPKTSLPFSWPEVGHFEALRATDFTIAS